MRSLVLDPLPFVPIPITAIKRRWHAKIRAQSGDANSIKGERAEREGERERERAKRKSGNGKGESGVADRPDYIHSVQLQLHKLEN